MNHNNIKTFGKIIRYNKTWAWCRQMKSEKVIHCAKRPRDFFYFQLPRSVLNDCKETINIVVDLFFFSNRPLKAKKKSSFLSLRLFHWIVIRLFSVVSWKKKKKIDFSANEINFQRNTKKIIFFQITRWPLFRSTHVFLLVLWQFSRSKSCS